MAKWGSPLSYKCKAECLSQIMIDETTRNKLFCFFSWSILYITYEKVGVFFSPFSLFTVQNYSVKFSLITVEWHCTKTIQIFCWKFYIINTKKKKRKRECFNSFLQTLINFTYSKIFQVCYPIYSPPLTIFSYELWKCGLIFPVAVLK